jgi:hypothetical protein
VVVVGPRVGLGGRFRGSAPVQCGVEAAQRLPGGPTATGHAVGTATGRRRDRAIEVRETVARQEGGGLAGAVGCTLGVGDHGLGTGVGVGDSLSPRGLARGHGSVRQRPQRPADLGGSWRMVRVGRSVGHTGRGRVIRFEPSGRRPPQSLGRPRSDIQRVQSLAGVGERKARIDDVRILESREGVPNRPRGEASLRRVDSASTCRCSRGLSPRVSRSEACPAPDPSGRPTPRRGRVFLWYSFVSPGR